MNKDFFIYPLLLGLMPSSLLLMVPVARNLEYEYALGTSWIFLGVGLCLSVMRRRPLFSSVEKFPFRFSAVTFIGALIPGAVLFVGSLCACSVQGFFFWMFLLTGPAILWAVFFILLARKMRRWRWIPWCLTFLIIILDASLLWFFPQKRLTGIILGFIHGPIYDRYIPVDMGIMAGRISHALLAVSGILYLEKSFKPKRWLFLISLVAVAYFQVASLRMASGGHGLSSISTRLSSILSGDGFELYYQRENEQDEEKAKSLAKEAAFHIDEISAILKIQLPRKIKIFAYSSSLQKKILFGGGATDVADVWMPSVHILLQPTPHPSLRHELVHAVASFIGWHGLGFHPNMLITEGLAMALAPTDEEISLHELSGDLLNRGRLEDVESLFSPLGFWQASGMRSYAVAGSIIRWVIDHYSAEVIQKVYSGSSFEEATGIDLKTLTERWKVFVLEQVKGKELLVAEQITRSPGVLQDVCPHTYEDYLVQNPGPDLVKFRRPWSWSPQDAFAWKSKIDPHSEELKLEALKQKVLKVVKNEQTSALEQEELLRAVQLESRWPPKTIEDVERKILETDLYGSMGRTQNLITELQSLVTMMASKEIGNTLRRQILVRQKLLGSLRDNGERRLWFSYVAGWSKIPDQKPGEPWVLSYLRARVMLSPSLEDLKAWISIIRKNVDIPEVRIEWLRMTGLKLQKLGAYQESSALFKEIAGLSTGEKALQFQEESRKASFFGKGT